MRQVILAMLLMSGAGYGCATQSSSADRQGRFDKPPLQLGTCTTMGVHVRNPDMYLNIGGETGDYSIAASRTKDGAAIWKIILNDAGSNSSTVALRGSGASAAELDETWRIVEFCETYKSG